MLQNNIQPILIPHIAHKYFEFLISGKILNISDQVTYEYMLEICQNYQIIKNYIDIVEDQHIGKMLRANTQMPPNTDLIYTGTVHIIPVDQRIIIQDPTYLLCCTIKNSIKIKIYIDASDPNTAIARFTMHAPSVTTLDLNIMIANMKFRILWTIKDQQLYILVVQRSIRIIKQYELLAIDYGTEYWI